MMANNSSQQPSINEPSSDNALKSSAEKQIIQKQSDEKINTFVTIDDDAFDLAIFCKVYKQSYDTYAPYINHLQVPHVELISTLRFRRAKKPATVDAAEKVIDLLTTVFIRPFIPRLIKAITHLIGRTYFDELYHFKRVFIHLINPYHEMADEQPNDFTSDEELEDRMAEIEDERLRRLYQIYFNKLEMPTTLKLLNF